MHLRAMMTTRATSDEDVSKLIGTMELIQQRLLNVCPDGKVSVDDIYVSSLIYALPEDWVSVTSPLELQAEVTPVEMKAVLRGHLTKLKNQEVSLAVSSSTALSATVANKKSRNPPLVPPRPECTYCQRKGHMSEICHRKLLDDQQTEIYALKQLIQSKSTKSAKIAHLSSSDSSSDDDCRPSAKPTSTAHVKFQEQLGTPHTTRTTGSAITLTPAARTLWSPLVTV